MSPGQGPWADGGRQTLGGLWALAAVATAASAAMVAPPLLEAAGLEAASALARVSLAPICHQMNERSFVLAGSPLGICSRCTGLYTGFLAGCLFALLASWRTGAPRQAPGRPVLILAALPTLVEWLAAHAGQALWSYEGTNEIRAILGALLGFAAASYAAVAAAELPREIARELEGVRIYRTFRWRSHGKTA